MTDPFTTWSRLASASLDMMRTGAKASRMVEASHEVVSKRTDMIRTAIETPMLGDYVELGRMVPEKVEAFTQAASAVGAEWWSMQMAFLAEAQQFSTMASRGRPPTMAEMSAAASRNVTYMTRSVERMAAMARLALAPVHATVTANARRLKA